MTCSSLISPRSMASSSELRTYWHAYGCVKTPAAAIPLPFLALISWAVSDLVCYRSWEITVGNNLRAESVPRKNLPLLFTSASSSFFLSSGVCDCISR